MVGIDQFLRQIWHSYFRRGVFWPEGWEGYYSAATVSRAEAGQPIKPKVLKKLSGDETEEVVGNAEETGEAADSRIPLPNFPAWK